MTTPHQWIERAERLPMESDSDNRGFVWFFCPDKSLDTPFPLPWQAANLYEWTHWCPIAKAPPLPKPKELTQEEKDRAWAQDLYDGWCKYTPFMAHCFGERCINYGRAVPIPKYLLPERSNNFLTKAAKP